MIFCKKKADGFFRGLGAEFAFKTKEGVFIVSGGRILKIGLVSEKQTNGTVSGASIVMTGGDQDMTIDKGGVEEMARRYVAIANLVTERRSNVVVRRPALVVALAAFTALSLFYGYLRGGPSLDQSDMAALGDAGKLISSMPAGSLPTMPSGAPASIGSSMGAFANNPMFQPPGAQRDAPSAPKIVDKPDFLNLPGDTSSKADKPADKAPDDKPQASVDAPTPEKAKTDDDAIVPAYSKDLYAPKSLVAATPVAAPKADTPVEKPVASADAAPAATDPDRKSLQDAVRQSPPVTADVRPVVAPLPPAPTASQAPASNTTASSVKPDDKAKAQQAVTSMMSKGMTKEQGQAVVDQLRKLGSMDPDMITPDMLSALPPEVADIVKASGVNVGSGAMPAGENGTPYAIIRLPEKVIDSFRGKDGIPSIPTNDSYAATGNKISLPLPGGGDIRTPEDLKAFGFKP